jgi:hypothetical protein
MSKAVMIIAALGVSLSTLVFAADQKAPAYQPFPRGYGYMDPSEIAALQQAWKNGDHKTVREHGWKLWAGIMQQASDAKWPVWFTWPNTKAAFLPTAGAKLDIAQAQAQPSSSLLQRNRLNIVTPINVAKLPYYPIPAPVLKTYPAATTTCSTPDNPNNICDGTHFLFNGDILIPTESLSREGYDWIRDKHLYLADTLDTDHKNGQHELDAPQRHVVTKHMFWPVKAGLISAIPVWHDYRDAKYPDYAGYETWPDLVAVDPTGRNAGKTLPVSYLYGVYQSDKTTPWPTVSGSAKVYGLDDFYYHKVTAEDWNSFDEADKAILNAASYWSYNQPFGVGDFLVTIAMHVNTKEIPTWALQSVWWSDRPNTGPYAANRPQIPLAKGPWTHYLLADSYGIPDKVSGKQPVAMNPYIELAIHPVGTNCNTCHSRAGWPTGKGEGQASYQNPDCPDPLQTLTPSSGCLAKLTLTEFQWIIPDRATKGSTTDQK